MSKTLSTMGPAIEALWKRYAEAQSYCCIYKGQRIDNKRVLVGIKLFRKSFQNTFFQTIKAGEEVLRHIMKVYGASTLGWIMG